MQNKCAVCGGILFSTVENSKVGITPYLSCTNCGFWAQFPPPVFRWESELQPVSGKELMHDYAKALNDDLANRLLQRHRPESVLDIGSKYPYLLHCFKKRGVAEVLGIDGCSEAMQYGLELDVPMAIGNFLDYDFGGKKFDLITMVHCIEHFSDPTLAIKKIKHLLSDRGVLYIRTPENGQAAIDSHLSAEHYSVHPVVFSKKSFHLLAQQEGFTIFDEWEQSEQGQIDWQLRKKEDIRISFCVIACSEEEVIGRMLESITPAVWELIVYLNNCTDNTPNIIKEWASKNNKKLTILDGFWDYNFARARNEAILKAEGTHVAWMDCDDVLSPEAPAKILALIEERPDSPQDWRLIYGGDTFFHCRLWKNEGRPFKPHFHDKCHEYVQLGEYGKYKIKCDDITLQHLPKPKDASTRNLRILTDAKEKGPQLCRYCGHEMDSKGRTLFYLANGLREAGRHEEALENYDIYLNEDLGFHDERFWAYMFKAQDYSALNKNQEAIQALCNAIAMNSHWAEPFMAIARIKYNEKKYKECIAWALHAASQIVPNTLMFQNIGAYKDQPWRLISWCWQHLGEIDKAIQHADIANRHLQGNDQEWNNRTADLKRMLEGKPSMHASKEIVQVMRPGALGDVLMSTAACKELKKAGYHVRYVCHPASVEAIIDNPYVDEVVQVSENNWQKILAATQKLPSASRVVYFQYPLDEGYPEKPMRQHLSHFFCDQAGVTRSTDLSIGLKQEHLDYGAVHGTGKVVIHTTAGWSPLKNWPIDRWAELVSLINMAGLEVIQIGSDREETVPGAVKLATTSIRHAAAVQKFSQAFIGVDSIFNHTSQAVGKRSVILWGSTHPRGSGYLQNINLVNGVVWTPDMGDEDPTWTCQPCYREYNSISVHPKPPCPKLVSHPISTLPKEEYPDNTLNACMAANEVNIVWKHIQTLLGN